MFFFFCPLGMKIEFSKLKKRVRACGHLVHDYPRYEHRCGSNSYQPPAILFLLVWSTPWQISITRGIFKILREENVQIKSSSGKRILMYLPWYSAVTYSVASVYYGLFGSPCFIGFFLPFIFIFHLLLATLNCKLFFSFSLTVCTASFIH